jgi:hypothetical protein
MDKVPPRVKAKADEVLDEADCEACKSGAAPHGHDSD